ncbi:MAG TPA: radical SAM family heme chaperone HemW [Acidimicrobiales bacterium]|nr:radical SAM family heme chaperone HemW [Acidimicrobiales bacterium]
MTGAFGVYVHVPFCARRCDYCAFATWTDRAPLMGAYADACVAELEAAGLPPATSVFFGGGTPSLLPAAGLAAVLAAVERAPGAEVTVECNPDDVTAALLGAYRDAGVTRISLGVQSLRDHVLAALGRAHRPAAALRAAWLVAAAGFASWSVDLIFGAAGESVADWSATVAEVLALGPPHVSAYALTVEAGTPLAADPARFPDDDDQADKYLAADAAFEAAGLRSYEVSNWARPGHECRHNLLYWSQGDYRGIGAAAHSHQAGRRWWNVRTPERYIERVAAGRPPEAAAEVLDAEERRREALQLSLRTRAGVPAGALPDGLDGLVERRGERLVLTPRGRLVGNEVAVRLR